MICEVYINMQKINRIAVFNLIIIATLAMVVLLIYKFLWPVLLFTTLGTVAAMVRKQ